MELKTPKAFSEGKVRPKYISTPKVLDYSIEEKAKEQPISDFGRRLLQDFPSITKGEVRDITFNLLRSAASVSPPGGSSTSVANPSRPKAIRMVQNRHIVSAK